MRILLLRRDLVCQQAVELVTDYLEGALSRKERNHFEAHLRGCPNCLAYLEQMQATVRAVRALASDDLTPAARTELTELFRRWQSRARQLLWRFEFRRFPRRCPRRGRARSRRASIARAQPACARR